jgi:hypothetical protein
VSGDVLAVGAPTTVVNGNTNSGAAYVFYRDLHTTAWREQKQVLPHDSAELFDFGSALALDRDTLAVALPSGMVHGRPHASGVYVFRRDHGGADQWGEVLKIADPFVDANSVFALSVAISAELIFVGGANALSGYPDYEGIGRVIVFERDRGGPDAWGRVTTIFESDVDGTSTLDEAFGRALAVDGDNLLIGAPPAEYGRTGAAYMFRRDSVDRDRWQYVTRLSAATGRGALENFGQSVALAGDTAVVGAPGYYLSEANAAYVFRHDDKADAWNAVGEVKALDEERNTGFGQSLASTPDRIVISAPNRMVESAPARGAVYEFTRSQTDGQSWGQTAVLTATNGEANDEFGSAVAIDELTTLAGAPQRGNDWVKGEHNFGGVYLYDVEATSNECQPALQPSDTLVDSGEVAKSGNLSLSASPGALEAPLRVWVEAVPAPAEPLPPGLTLLGGHYNIGAECSHLSPANSPFVIRLPVPPGAPVDRMFAVALVPTSTFVHPLPLSKVWLPVFGTYDAERGAYAVDTAGLHSEGMTMALAEDPALGQPQTRSRPGRTPSTTLGLTPDDVACIGLGNLCNGDLPAKTYQYLQEASEQYSNQGFPEPRLRRLLSPSRIRGGGVRLVSRRTWFTLCYPEADAVYEPYWAEIDLCVDESQPPSDQWLRQNVRHELFHAIQHTYVNVGGGPGRMSPATEAWILEGTAQTAAGWDGAAPHRVTDHPLMSPRSVAVSIESNEISASRPYAYEAQDFWIYLLSSKQLPLGELNSFFERGATTESVAERMEYPPDPRYARLGEEYWAWAKNQAYENKTKLHTTNSTECAVTSTAGAVQTHTYRPPTPDGGGSTDVGVEFRQGLESRLVIVTIDDELADGVDNLTFKVDNKNVGYKVYSIEPPDGDCHAEADGPRTFAHLDAGANVLILLSNKEYGAAAFSRRVTVSIQ